MLPEKADDHLGILGQQEGRETTAMAEAQTISMGTRLTKANHL